MNAADWFPGPIPALSSLKSIELRNSISRGLGSSTETSSSSSGKTFVQINKRIESNHDNDEEDNELSSMIERSDKDVDINYTQAKIYLDIYRYENIGILVSYFLVGFAMYFAVTPLHFYLISTQNASSAQIGVLISVQSLPWSMKIFYGLLSDSVPIFQYRRKPYVFLGWLSYSLINIIMSMLSTPGIRTCIIGAFFMCSSLLLADVATDALSVERAKLESDTRKGSLQTTGYTCRAMGMVFGALLGSVLYNKDAWGWGLTIAQVLLINGLIPGVMILFYGMPLVELSFSVQVPSLRVQIQVCVCVFFLSIYWFRLFLSQIYFN